MFNRAAYENTQPDGIPVLEVVEEKPKEEQPRRFVPLKRSELTGEIVGPLASLCLRQVYGYSREQCAEVLQAIYRFPLPGDAAVTDVRVRFGDVEIIAELKERAQAEAEYQEAVKQGQQAALATRESPQVFTLRVAGIRPDEEIAVETRYVQLARAEGLAWVLRVPLTTAPRYVRSDELSARHAQGQPLMLLRDPGHRFTLDIQVRGAQALSSPTHELRVEEEGQALRVRLREGEVLPDRDCVLTWLPRQQEALPTLQVLAHDDQTGEQAYFLALVAPPARCEGPGVPREVILLVDHSGSMEGAKWEASDWAVDKFLSDLGPQDTFALGLFHNTTRWFAERPVAADAATIEKAIRFLKESRDSGGTELGVALEQALSLPRSSGDRARHVLVVTDAQVTDAERILRLADEEAKQPQRRRISILCIDAAPNSFLALELAERGGGLARFLTSSPEQGDITTALDEVLADWAEPLLADLQLEVNRARVEASGRAVAARGAWSAIDLGELPGGRALWVAGRVPREGGRALSLRLMQGQTELAACRVDLGGETQARAALKALFGARRVLGLEHLMRAGYDEAQLRAQLERLGYDAQAILSAGQQDKRKVYAENVRLDAERLLKDLLVREALDYGLASAETAFVAIRREAGQRVQGTVAVANALPEGWSDAFAGFPGVMPSPPPGAYRSMGMPLQVRMPGFGIPKGSVYSDALTGAAAPQAAPPSQRRETAAKVFSGAPTFGGQEALLFDSTRSAGAGLPDSLTFKRLVVRLGGADRDVQQAARDARLLLYVGDASAPRASMRLSDLLKRNGERPLNLLRQAGALVRLVLQAPSGTWPPSVTIEITLMW